MSCNGICRHRGGVKNARLRHVQPYEIGYSYCPECELYFFTLGRPARCPCCKIVLRLRPRESRSEYSIVSRRRIARI